MPGKRRTVGIDSIISSFGNSGLSVELRKSTKGAVVVISGIVSISDCSEKRVELLSHSGRITLEGDWIEVSVLENRTVEIYGRITEVRLSYGKA